MRAHARTLAHTQEARKEVTSRLGKFYNTLNNLKSSSGEPWKFLQAVPGVPEIFGYPVYYPDAYM